MAKVELLNGRRWVPSSMEAECFRNAQIAVDRIIEPLNQLVETAQHKKPSRLAVDRVLVASCLLEILNLLPVYFEKFQNDVVHKIRNLAIASFNEHDDIELSRQIIEYAKRLKFRTASANQAILNDVATIDEIIRKKKEQEAKAREHEYKNQAGDERWEITMEEVRKGNKFSNCPGTSPKKMT